MMVYIIQLLKRFAVNNRVVTYDSVEVNNCARGGADQTNEECIVAFKDIVGHDALSEIDWIIENGFKKYLFWYKHLKDGSILLLKGGVYFPKSYKFDILGLKCLISRDTDEGFVGYVGVEKNISIDPEEIDIDNSLTFIEPLSGFNKTIDEYYKGFQLVIGFKQMFNYGLSDEENALNAKEETVKLAKKLYRLI